MLKRKFFLLAAVFFLAIGMTAYGEVVPISRAPYRGKVSGRSIFTLTPPETITEANIDIVKGYPEVGLPAKPFTMQPVESRIRQGVPVVINSKVRYFIRYFQTRGRAFFEGWLARSSAYLPMIKDILRSNRLPEDLAYLALIESGFNTRAYSKAHAAGIWQFMKWTGKHYGLRVDWWIDERRDPEKSTRAAAAFLKELYGMFDSWPLVAASYNGGAGRVRYAIQKYRTRDFWVMASKRKGIRRETRNYVPKYMAAMIIAKDPGRYGFKEIDYYPPIEYDKVNISVATDLRVIADACVCSIKEIKRLNPELRRWYTPPNYPEYEIKIPIGRTRSFLENMSRVPRARQLRFLRHRIKSGDSVYTIARRYGSGVKPILYLNKIRNVHRLRVGRLIFVPVRTRLRSKTVSKSAVTNRAGTYMVKYGDTLWDISRRFGI